MHARPRWRRARGDDDGRRRRGEASAYRSPWSFCSSRFRCSSCFLRSSSFFRSSTRFLSSSDFLSPPPHTFDQNLRFFFGSSEVRSSAGFSCSFSGLADPGALPVVLMAGGGGSPAVAAGGGSRRALPTP